MPVSNRPYERGWRLALLRRRLSGCGVPHGTDPVVRCSCSALRLCGPGDLRRAGEAIAAGRPVVATAFPHAVESLASGAGIVVDRDDRQRWS